MHGLGSFYHFSGSALAIFWMGDVQPGAGTIRPDRLATFPPMTFPPAVPPDPPPCKRIVALLGPAPRPSDEVYLGLEEAFGPVDYKGESHPFDTTDYYAAEFGAGLWRGFASFRGLAAPESLAVLKHRAAGLEAAWSRDGRRTWNVDVGYMDADKVVLASFKRGPLKLYVGNGVYADLLLKYAKGRFEPLPWAFADFKDGRYSRSLLAIREKLKAEMHRHGAAESGSKPGKSGKPGAAGAEGLD
jgi:hypothetical protein